MCNSTYNKKRIISAFIKNSKNEGFTSTNNKVVYFKKHLAYQG